MTDLLSTQKNDEKVLRIRQRSRRPADRGVVACCPALVSALEATDRAVVVGRRKSGTYKGEGARAREVR